MNIVNKYSRFFSFAIVGIMCLSCRCFAEWREEPSAVQKIYMDHVPHTDKMGRYMKSYNEGKSFFPIVLYHGPFAEKFFGSESGCEIVKNGNFNGIHARYKLIEKTEGGLRKLLNEMETNNIQVILQDIPLDLVKAHKNNQNILAWYLLEEPISKLGKNDEGRYADYIAKYEALKKIDPERAAFLLDSSWITPPATGWWKKWNTTGDITSHDNYHLLFNKFINNELHNSETLNYPLGLAVTVSLAASINNYSKPMWFCVQAFSNICPKWPCRMPTPTKLRGMVFTSIIHGATGVIYFGFDSAILRDGNCVGIAPHPSASYAVNRFKPLTVSNDSLIESEALWKSVVRLNAQLEKLKPAILSPTSSLPYFVYRDDSWSSYTKNPIRTLLKKDPRGGYVMLICNLDNCYQKLKIKIPDLKFRPFIDDESSGLLKSEGDTFELMLDPFGGAAVRIVELDSK